MTFPKSGRAAPASPSRLEDLLALDGSDFVQAAYHALLHRDPDPKGFVEYLDQLAEGIDKLQILHEIRWSPEGQVCGAQIVGLAQGDSSVHAATPSTAAPGSATLDALMRLHGARFVEQAYALLLGREADASGLAYYTARLQAGDSRTQVLRELAASEESMRRKRHLPGLEAALQREPTRHHPLLRAVGRITKRWRASAAQPPDHAAPPPLPARHQAASAAPADVGGMTASAATATAANAGAPGAEPAARPQPTKPAPRTVGANRQWLQTQPSLEDREGWRLP